MRSIRSKKVWVIAIAILFFTLSIFGPSIDYQNTQYNAGNTLNYRLTTNIILALRSSQLFYFPCFISFLERHPKKPMASKKT